MYVCEFLHETTKNFESPVLNTLESYVCVWLRVCVSKRDCVCVANCSCNFPVSSCITLKLSSITCAIHSFSSAPFFVRYLCLDGSRQSVLVTRYRIDKTSYESSLNFCHFHCISSEMSAKKKTFSRTDYISIITCFL